MHKCYHDLKFQVSPGKKNNTPFVHKKKIWKNRKREEKIKLWDIKKLTTFGTWLNKTPVDGKCQKYLFSYKN